MIGILVGIAAGEIVRRVGRLIWSWWRCRWRPLYETGWEMKGRSYW